MCGAANAALDGAQLVTQVMCVCDPQPELGQVDAHLTLAASTGDADMARLDQGGGGEETKAELAIKQLFKKLQWEEEERIGYFSGIDSRLHFVDPSLRISKTIRNQVAQTTWYPGASLSRAPATRVDNQRCQQGSHSGFEGFEV